MRKPRFIRYRRLLRIAKETAALKAEALYNAQAHKLRVLHGKVLEKLEEEHNKALDAKRRQYDKDLKTRESYYDVQEKKLDDLYDKLRKKEDHLDSLIDQVQGFLGKVMLVVKQTSKEYKTVLNDIARASDSAYAVDKLESEYNKMITKTVINRHLIDKV